MAARALFVISILATTSLACDNSMKGCLTCTDEANCKAAGCSYVTIPFFGGKCATGDIAAATDKVTKAAASWTKCGEKVGGACSAPDCGLVGTVCMPKAAADKANSGISSSKELTKLGKDMKGVMKGIFNEGKASEDQIKQKLAGLSGTDLATIATGLSDQIKNGAKVSKSTLVATMNKMKEKGAWGAVNTWDVGKIKQAGQLLDGLSVQDLGDISEDNFDAALSSFGDIEIWAKDQATKLADKLIASAGDPSKITADALNKAKGFLSGMDKTTLSGLSQAAFTKAKDSFKAAADKLGAFSNDQVESMSAKVKAGLGGDLTKVTALAATQYGSLMGTLSPSDLKSIPKTAFAGMKAEAIRLMAGDVSKFTTMTKEQLKAMPSSARQALNGAGLKALANDLEKVKAVMGCADDVAKCPGAVTDIAIKFDSLKTTATAMLEQVKATLKAAGHDYSTCTTDTCKKGVQLLDTGVTITAMTAVTARRASSGNAQTTVRVNAATPASASAAATASGALGSTSTVGVTSVYTSSAASGPTTAVAAIVAATAVYMLM